MPWSCRSRMADTPKRFDERALRHLPGGEPFPCVKCRLSGSGLRPSRSMPAARSARRGAPQPGQWSREAYLAAEKVVSRHTVQSM